MKKNLLATMILAASALLGQVSLGINIGPPPPPRVVHVQPHSPGAGYNWVDGYWFANNNKWAWHDGYWTRPPYAGAIWTAPRYEGKQFYQGYWAGPNPNMYHDHRWDKDKKNRDYNRYGH